MRLFLPKFEVGEKGSIAFSSCHTVHYSTLTHQVRHKSQLSQTLRQLGLPVHGDYTGITNQGLQVDEVVHEAVLRFVSLSHNQL